MNQIELRSVRGATAPAEASRALRLMASRRDGRLTVRVQGDLDLQTCEAFAAGLAVFPDDDGRLIVDMSEVGFIDSSGLKALIDASNARPGDGCGVRIVNGSTAVLRLLELTALGDKFGV